jgi:hypothetical protein
MIVNILNFDHYFLQLFINSKEERNVKPKVIDPGTPLGSHQRDHPGITLGIKGWWLIIDNS